MKRRNLLAGIPLVATGFSGCLSGRTNDQNDSQRTAEQINYEECSKYIVDVGNLPSAAEDEVRAAIEDEGYETDDELILTKVIDIDQSYLEEDINGETFYYEATVETDDGSTRLFIEKVVPEHREGPITIWNTTENDLTVNIRIEYEGDLFFEESIEIRAGETFEVKGESKYRYGVYHAEINVPNEETITENENTWLAYRRQVHPLIEIREQEGIQFGDRNEVDAAPSCLWNEDGELRDNVQR
jgi:hypothetical protein